MGVWPFLMEEIMLEIISDEYREEYRGTFKRIVHRNHWRGARTLRI